MKDRLQDGNPQAERQEFQKIIIYGVKQRDIRKKHLGNILQIYGEVAGITDWIERQGVLLLVGEIKRMLDTDSVGLDLRYGSTIGQTKLMSRKEWDVTDRQVIQFYMNPNVGQSSKDYQVGEKMAADFRTRVNEYLIEEGIARRIR